MALLKKLKGHGNHPWPFFLDQVRSRGMGVCDRE
jgi:hypothetical protein